VRRKALYLAANAPMRPDGAGSIRDPNRSVFMLLTDGFNQ